MNLICYARIFKFSAKTYLGSFVWPWDNAKSKSRYSVEFQQAYESCIQMPVEMNKLLHPNILTNMPKLSSLWIKYS